MAGHSVRSTTAGVVLLATLAAAVDTLLAQPDAAVCEIQQVVRNGEVDGISAYSVGLTQVNLGDSNLEMILNGPDHPVLGHNLFRLLEGRFEHIGQSWVWHNFCALQVGSDCTPNECTPVGGCLNYLSPYCEDPHSASSEGSQFSMGPKSEVTATTGAFSWPFDSQGVAGDVIFKRLQVRNQDLGIPGALYFLEGQIVAPDDAAAGNQDNNASYRQVNVGPPPSYAISFIPGIAGQFERPAIMAWPAHDPGSTVTQRDVPGDGSFFVGYAAWELAEGLWHYEFALQNLNSDRSAGSFSVPVPGGVRVSDVGFHDVDYHSGEPYDGTDWTAVIADGSITWSTESFLDNPHANALRWGTLYNFRFNANRAPAPADVTVGLFKPGAPQALTAPAVGPAVSAQPCSADINGNGAVDAGDLALLLGAWGTNPGHSADLNGDTLVDAADLAFVLGGWGPCP